MKQRKFTQEEIKDYRNRFKRYLKQNPALEKFYFNNFHKIKKLSIEELRNLEFCGGKIPEDHYLKDDSCYGYKSIDKNGKMTSWVYVHPDIGIVNMTIEEGFSKDVENIFYIFWIIKLGYEYNKKYLSIISKS